MENYKFESDVNSKQFYTGNTSKTNDTYLQMGTEFIELDDLKKIKEAVGDNVEEPETPSLEKMMLSISNQLIRYMKSAGIQSNYAMYISNHIFNLINHLIDKGYNSSIDRYLQTYLNKFYNAIGMK